MREGNKKWNGIVLGRTRRTKGACLPEGQNERLCNVCVVSHPRQIFYLQLRAVEN